MINNKFILLLLLALMKLLCELQGCQAQTTVNVTTVNGTTGTGTTDVIAFPYMENPCTCKGLITCNCCQSIIVNPLQLEKKICIELNVKILGLTIGVKISVDNKIVSEFTIDPKNPPKYCIPIIIQSVAMCVKLHDVKLVGLTGVQVCSTIYANYETNEVFAYKFPCLKLSGDGVTVM